MPRPFIRFALVAAFVAGFAGGAAASTDDASSQVCAPDPVCAEACQLETREVRRTCILAGYPREECREKAREVRKACLASECRPTLDCEERCEVQGKRLLKRCIEQGGNLETCRSEAKMATMACIEDRCGSCNCPDVYDPVCGADMMTYSNRCEARCAGVDVKHEGTCEPTKCPPIACDVFCEYGHKTGPDGCPTCECNPRPGCQDDSECGAGLECRKICPLAPCQLGRPCPPCLGVCAPKPKPEPEPCLCPQVWAPVCGSDGITYTNGCAARCAGVDVKHEGVCEPYCPPNALCPIPFPDPVPYPLPLPLPHPYPIPQPDTAWLYSVEAETTEVLQSVDR